MMNSNNYIEVKTGKEPVDLATIPVTDYASFHEQVVTLLQKESCHCLHYFCFPEGKGLRFLALMADDDMGSIMLLSHKTEEERAVLQSIAATTPALQIFEREMHEAYGIHFTGHPWLKPVRYPHDRTDKESIMNDYPFYEMASEELHEVGVGPIHAGVIEPGHFRFICNGEKVLHLEIQLGYQHRGVEKLFRELEGGLQRVLLAENIAGDTTIGHSLAHVQLIESLAGFIPPDNLQAERSVALEMERIAVHIGDTAALCADVAYQLGQVVCEALRTMVINTTQYWCGNRFGKSLIRPFGTNHPLTDDIVARILDVLSEVERRFANVADCIYTLPSVLARFEETGRVTRNQAATIGAVGMAARSCGIMRDVRKTHPFQYYSKMEMTPVILDSGDVLARGRIRTLEVKASVELIRRIIEKWRKMEHTRVAPVYDYNLEPGKVALSVTEGWRGEICHAAVTDHDGSLVRYTIKDPSMHNWMALALAVRNQEISDFPVCNKSFNLSYCGHDL